MGSVNWLPWLLFIVGGIIGFRLGFWSGATSMYAYLAERQKTKKQEEAVKALKGE